jgi:predicted O-methyltransferase YrrM
MELWLKVLGGPRNIVELGTWTGNSAFAWLACPNTFVWAIDNVDNASSLREDVKRYGWENRLSFLKGDSVAWATPLESKLLGPPAWGWSSEPFIDLLYIDTSHEYLQTRREIEAWLPHLKHGGWLVLDDAVGYSDVTKAFQYCLDVSCQGMFNHYTVFTGPTYTPKTHGLLVAQVK